MKRKGDTFTFDFDGQRYTMSVDKAKEMLTYLEGLMDEESVKQGLPEFIHSIRTALGERTN
jgi:hypothetical protein